MNGPTGKLTILAVSFALFVAAVWALYAAPEGPLRTGVLAGSLAALCLIALGLTVRNARRGRKR